MARGKMVYVSDATHRALKILAARRNQPMGSLVEDLVEREIADLTNPWLTPEGLSLQEKALSQVWAEPELDVYDRD